VDEGAEPAMVPPVASIMTRGRDLFIFL
jgi:hypothetical protein